MKNNCVDSNSGSLKRFRSMDDASGKNPYAEVYRRRESPPRVVVPPGCFARVVSQRSSDDLSRPKIGLSSSIMPTLASSSTVVDEAISNMSPLPNVVPTNHVVSDLFLLDEEFNDNNLSVVADPSVDLKFDDLEAPSEESEANKMFSDVVLKVSGDEELGGGCEQLEEKSSLFLDVDEEDLCEITAGGSDPSAAAERCFQIRFKKWQQEKNFHPDIQPEDMPLPMLAEALVPYLMALRKLNGDFYPSQSLAQMFRACSRLIRRKQISRINETLVDEVPIILQKHALFLKPRLALVEAMDRSIKAGANKPRKKSNPLRWKDEEECLKDIDMQITHAHGVQKRWAFFCLSRFLIRGYNEVHRLMDTDFCADENEYGKFVKYSERDSKNYKVSMTKCQPEHFRQDVVCYEVDVVDTFTQLMRHMPPKPDSTIGRRIFLQVVKGNPRTNAWFNTNHVGVKVITSWLKNMTGLIEMPGYITNKSPRYATIERMIQAGVPSKVGMAITRHKSEESYQRYDQNMELQKMAAMSIVAEPFRNGKRRIFEEVFSEISRSTVEKELVGSCTNILKPTSKNFVEEPAGVGLLKETGSLTPDVDALELVNVPIAHVTSTDKDDNEYVTVPILDGIEPVVENIINVVDNQTLQASISENIRVYQEVLCKIGDDFISAEPVLLPDVAEVAVVSNMLNLGVVTVEKFHHNVVRSDVQHALNGNSVVGAQRLGNVGVGVKKVNEADGGEKKFTVHDDICDLEESALVSLLEGWPECAKVMNVTNSSFVSTKIGSSFNNCSNFTLNLSVDPNMLKDFF